MIRPISSCKFTTLLSTLNGIPKDNQIASFKGILDNPESQRIKGKDGNTYIVEPGGRLVIVNKDKNKGSVRDTLTAGAGGTAAGVTGTKMLNDSQHNSASNSGHDVTVSPQGHSAQDNEIEQQDNTAPISDAKNNTETIPDSDYDGFDDDDSPDYDDPDGGMF